LPPLRKLAAIARAAIGRYHLPATQSTSSACRLIGSQPRSPSRPVIDHASSEMSTEHHDESHSVATRATAIRLIERYPDIGDDDLETVLRYLREDAPAADIEHIRSELDPLPQFQQLCRDHYLWRLSPSEKVFAAAASLGIVLILWLLRLLADTI